LTLYALADRALAEARRIGPGATERHPPASARGPRLAVHGL
jgi:hypothetical protein